MIRLVSNLLKSNSAPIGIDLGSAALKLAQVARTSKGSAQVIAMASAELPPELRNDPRGRFEFFVATVPQLLSQGFRGRRVVLGLPAACMHFARVRIPPMDEASTRQAIVFEASGELPYHASHATIRHLMVGEVYEGNERRNEVIVMATRRDLTDQFLSAAARAKLDVVGVCAEPSAVATSISEADAAASQSPQSAYARVLVDIGGVGTRIYIAHAGRIQFARAVSIGADKFDAAVVQQLGIPLTDARQLRRELASQQGTTSSSQAAATPAQSQAPSTALVVSSQARRSAELLRAEQACQQPLARLVEEIEFSCRYYSSTFPTTPLSEIVFVGGGAAHGRWCQQIAKQLRLAWGNRDIFQRLATPESIQAIGQTAAPSAWTVAAGLGMSAVHKSNQSQRTQNAA